MHTAMRFRSQSLNPETAQVVVFSGGTNDFHILPPPDLDTCTSAYVAFIEMVCHIMRLMWLMLA